MSEPSVQKQINCCSQEKLLISTLRRFISLFSKHNKRLNTADLLHQTQKGILKTSKEWVCSFACWCF